MYTFNPLPIVDTLNNHSGFYFFVFVFVVLCAAIALDRVFSFIGLITLSCIPLSIVGYISWNSGSIVVPKNEKVIAQYVSLEHEYQTQTVSQGKTSRVQVNHNTYVNYKVPEGIITLPAVVGIPYPEYAILYKN